MIKGDYAYVSLDKKVIDYIYSDTKSIEFDQRLLLDKNEKEILLSGYIDSRIEEVNKITKDFNIKEVKFNYENENLELNFKFQNSKTNALKQIFTMK